ncbi:MAG: sporulation integral membrane protein YtvI [Clostridia bacterium]|nr:sporulation integral membrane protein YtvI [Clostridia bacterium]
MNIIGKDPAKSLITLAYTILVIMVVLFVLPKAVSCILPFFFAWVISLIIKPVASLLRKLHIPGRLAVIISMLVVVGILCGVIYGISGVLVNEIKTVVNMFKDTRDGLPVFVWEFIEVLPGGLQSGAVKLVEYIRSDAQGLLMPAIKTALPKLGGAAGKIPGALVFTIVFLMALYFFSYDFSGFTGELKKFISEDKITYLRHIRDSFSKAFGGYVKAQLIIMGVVFCELLTGFLILDIKLSVLLALLISIIDAIPILGTGIILNPWAVFCLIQGNFTQAVGLVCMYLIVLLTRQFIEPRVLSGQLGTHPLITLISMYAGLKLIGVIGMIMGPLVAIIVINVIKINKESNQNIEFTEVNENDSK